VETQLYDRFVQLEELVLDYLSPLHLRLQHDSRFGFVRVFPPGASVPGLPDDDQQPFAGGFRASLAQQEIAAVLVLRAEYDKSLREGQVDDMGCVLLSLEAFGIAMRNLLNRSMPEKKTERSQLFRRLRQLRLIYFVANTEDNVEDAWLKIRPSITSFVSDAVLQSMLDEMPPSDTEAAAATAAAAPESSMFDGQGESE
jgi:hypothetical protein